MYAVLQRFLGSPNEKLKLTVLKWNERKEKSPFSCRQVLLIVGMSEDASKMANKGTTNCEEHFNAIDAWFEESLGANWMRLQWRLGSEQTAPLLAEAGAVTKRGSEGDLS